MVGAMTGGAAAGAPAVAVGAVAVAAAAAAAAAEAVVLAAVGASGGAGVNVSVSGRTPTPSRLMNPSGPAMAIDRTPDGSVRGVAFYAPFDGSHRTDRKWIHLLRGPAPPDDPSFSLSSRSLPLLPLPPPPSIFPYSPA